MKESVFIGWSGNRALAIKVKEVLDNRGYSCVIGGDYEKNPEILRLRNRTVNETVCNQMDHCNQAIILFQKVKRNYDNNAEEGFISGNLVYELGYLTSKYPTELLASKVHVFKLDITPADEKIFPSDLHGVWGNNIETANYTEDEIVNLIVEEFTRCQKIKKIDDKFQLVNNYRHIEYAIDVHCSKPQYSNYELAKRIIFYVQAAFIYQEAISAEQKCQNLKTNLIKNNFTNELSLVLEYADLTFQMFKLATPDATDGRVHLAGKIFRKMIKDYKSLLSVFYCDERDERFDLASVVIESDGEDLTREEFRFWITAQAQEHITYLYLIYLDNPELTQEERAVRLKEAIKFGEVSVKNLTYLKEFNGNAEYAKLLLSYAYRNLSLFYKMLDEDKFDYEKQSFSLRKELYDKATKDPRINPNLKNYMALEYFLQIADSIKGMEDQDDREDALDEIENYIAETSVIESSKGLMFNRLIEVHKEIKKLILS